MAEEPEPQRQAAMEEFDSKRANGWGKDQQCDHAEELKTTECFGEKEEKCQELQVEEGKRELSMDVLVVVEQEPCGVEDVQGAEGARGTKEEKGYFPEGDSELPPHESVVSNGDVEGVPGLFVVDTEPGLGKNLYIETESTEPENEVKEKRKNKLRRKGGGAADASKARGKIAAEMVNPSEGVPGLFVVDTEPGLGKNLYIETESTETGKEEKRKNKLRRKGGGAADASKVREKVAVEMSKTWFELPMTEVSPEMRQNLLALRLRDYADPKRFYKPPDRAGFPKHFQMGTVLNSPVEFYSSRISRKMRQRNFLEEMMADAEQRSFRKRKMASIMAESQAKSAGKKIWLRLGGYKVLKRGVGKGGNRRNSTLALKKQKEKEKRKQRRLDL
uniref:Fcf2 pre-rRNA processing C-terminal domain-containing protein n=1 Tax=Eptatretus burgeri TaxID=7764 RepID=A0A8C4R8C0_EPTBU